DTCIPLHNNRRSFCTTRNGPNLYTQSESLLIKFEDQLIKSTAESTQCLRLLSRKVADICFRFPRIEVMNREAGRVRCSDIIETGTKLQVAALSIDKT